MSRQKAVRLYRRTAFCLPLSSTGRRHMYTFYCEWKTKKVHAEMYSLRTGALAPREPDTVFRAAGGAQAAAGAGVGVDGIEPVAAQSDAAPQAACGAQTAVDARAGVLKGTDKLLSRDILKGNQL